MTGLYVLGFNSVFHNKADLLSILSSSQHKSFILYTVATEKYLSVYAMYWLHLRDELKCSKVLIYV